MNRPHTAAKTNMSSRVDGSRDRDLVDSRTFSATKIASVALWTPISNEDAMAWRSVTPAARGTT